MSPPNSHLHHQQPPPHTHTHTTHLKQCRLSVQLHHHWPLRARDPPRLPKAAAAVGQPRLHAQGANQQRAHGSVRVGFFSVGGMGLGTLNPLP